MIQTRKIIDNAIARDHRDFSRLFREHDSMGYFDGLGRIVADSFQWQFLADRKPSKNDPFSIGEILA